MISDSAMLSELSAEFPGYEFSTQRTWEGVSLIAVRQKGSARSGLYVVITPDFDEMRRTLLDNTGLGFLHPNMLSHERSALIAVMITFVWSMFGTNLIIFLAGMATIDQEIYDAARVDGAGSLTVMFRITFPLLKRFVQFTFVISLITAFSALFSLIIVMTNGGPGYGSTTLEFFIYEQAFTENNFGVGATAGVVLFLLVFAVSMVQLRLLRSDD